MKSKMWGIKDWIQGGRRGKSKSTYVGYFAMNLGIYPIGPSRLFLSPLSVKRCRRRRNRATSVPRDYLLARLCPRRWRCFAVLGSQLLKCHHGTAPRYRSLAGGVLSIYVDCAASSNFAVFFYITERSLVGGLHQRDWENYVALSAAERADRSLLTSRFGNEIFFVGEIANRPQQAGRHGFR